MENTGLDSGMPTVLPPGITGEAWLRTITQYANSMRRQLPDVSHPSDEYLTEGAQLLSSDRIPSAVGNSSSQSDTLQESRPSLNEYPVPGILSVLFSAQYSVSEYFK